MIEKITIGCYLGVFQIQWYRYSFVGELYSSIKKL